MDDPLRCRFRQEVVRRVLSGPHCRHQAADPDQRHHPLDVVGKDVQRDLCFHVPQPSGQKVGRAHPRLDGAERVLDRASADGHRFGRTDQPRPRRLDQMLVRLPRDPALLAGRASRFHQTRAALAGPVAAEFQTVFLGRVAIR